MKFIIHYSDRYYPNVDEFTSLEEAVSRFKKLREERWDQCYEADPYFDKDYICIVIDEIDAKELVEQRKKFEDEQYA
jgi:hypothetical protein